MIWFIKRQEALELLDQVRCLLGLVVRKGCLGEFMLDLAEFHKLGSWGEKTPDEGSGLRMEKA